MKTHILISAIAPLLFGAGSASAGFLHEIIAVRNGLETIQLERRLDEQLFRLAGECKAAGGQPSESKVSGEDAEVARALDCAIGQASHSVELVGERGKNKDASLTLTIRFKAPMREGAAGLVESELFAQAEAMGLPDAECDSSIDEPAGRAALRCRGTVTTATYAAASAVRYAAWTDEAKKARAKREQAFAPKEKVSQ